MNNNQLEREKIDRNKNNKNIVIDNNTWKIGSTDFRYSSNEMNDNIISNKDNIFENLFSNNLNASENYGIGKINMNSHNSYSIMNHQPDRMNYDLSRNFQHKVSRSITDNNNENALTSKKQNRPFIPWKRAEIDPTIVTRGTEIHLNPIANNIFHEDLFNFFKRYGEVIHIRIITRKEKGNSFAFVRFLDRQSADKALNERTIILNVNKF